MTRRPEEDRSFAIPAPDAPRRDDEPRDPPTLEAEEAEGPEQHELFPPEPASQPDPNSERDRAKP
jgi:hypothetical protein